MKYRFSIIISFAALFSALTFSVASAAERTPQGSFLQYRANTVAELKRQLTNDRVAQARYHALFRVPTKDMISIVLESDPKLVSLKKATKVDMWYISGKGKISHKAKLLPKGSQVFMTANGKMLFAWSCGNPLRATLPRSVLASARRPSLNLSPDTKVKPLTEVVSEAVTATPEVLMETPVLDIVEQASVLSTAGAIAAPSISSFAPVLATAGSFNVGWLATGLAGLAAAVSVGHQTPSVPEPSSMISMLVALGSTSAYFIKKRRSY